MAVVLAIAAFPLGIALLFTIGIALYKRQRVTDRYFRLAIPIWLGVWLIVVVGWRVYLAVIEYREY